jgi:hypothetical protein
MKILCKNRNTRFLVKALLLTTFSTISVTVCSSGAPLKIGDEYGGGKIAVILEPGDPGYSDLAEQFMIASKADISESENLTAAQTASDKMEQNGYCDRLLQSKVPRNQVAVGGY